LTNCFLPVWIISIAGSNVNMVSPLDESLLQGLPYAAPYVSIVRLFMLQCNIVWYFSLVFDH
jgi:hypothetical protein